MKIKNNTKFAAMLALIATLICALVAGVTLLTLPQTEMTANAEGIDFSAQWTANKNGGILKLTDDWYLSEALTVGNGESITLDLNGHTIDRGLTGQAAVSSGSVIRVDSGGELTLEDNSAAQNGAITGGNSTSGGGISIGGTLTMNSGNIIGNSAPEYGGGVYVAGGGVFTMNGGTISNNVSVNYSGGAGVKAEGGSTFIMNGGTISGNKAVKDTVSDSLGYCGGVAVDGLNPYADAPVFKISGNAKIYGNTIKDEDTLSNLIVINTVIRIIGELKDKSGDKAEIWINRQGGYTPLSNDTPITSGYDYDRDGSASDYFKEDNGKYVILKGEEAHLSDSPAVKSTLSASEYDGTTPVKIEGYNKDTMEVSGLPEDWTIADDGTITIPENAEAKEYAFTITLADGYWDDGTQGAKEFKVTVKAKENGGDDNTGDNPGDNPGGGDNPGNNPGGDNTGDNTGDNPGNNGGNGGDNSADIGGNDSGNIGGNLSWEWTAFIVVGSVAIVLFIAGTVINIILIRKDKKKAEEEAMPEKSGFTDGETK